MRKTILCFCFTLLLAVMVVPAHADLIAPDRDADWTGLITSDHSTDGLGTAPFGQVDLWQETGFVILQASLYDDSEFVRTGAMDGYSIVFNGDGVVLGDLADPNGLLTFATANFSQNTLGSFEFGAYFTGQGNGGPPNSNIGPIIFQINNAVVADLNQPNAKGNTFLVDIWSGQTGWTGIADVSGGGTKVPEPSLIMLLGLGLGAVGLVSRRKK